MKKLKNCPKSASLCKQIKNKASWKLNKKMNWNEWTELKAIKNILKCSNGVEE